MVLHKVKSEEEVKSGATFKNLDGRKIHIFEIKLPRGSVLLTSVEFTTKITC